MLAYTKMRVQVLASMVPAHGMCWTLLIVLTIWSAGVHPDGRSSAVQKHTPCAQNVSDITNSLYILICWHIPRWEVTFSQVLRLCTEWQLTMNPRSSQACEPEGTVQSGLHLHGRIRSRISMTFDERSATFPPGSWVIVELNDGGQHIDIRDTNNF